MKFFYIFWKESKIEQNTKVFKGNTLFALNRNSGLNTSMQRPKTRHSKKHSPLEVYLTGPYGAPTSGLFYGKVEHAVLIATGIGVTPFASILQSIMFKYR